MDPEEVGNAIAGAHVRILVIGVTSFAFYGLYIATLVLTIWSSSLDGSSSWVLAQRRIRWISCITAALLTVRQILITFSLTGGVCTWALLPVEDRLPMCAQHSSTPPIYSFVNIYIPPLVALLSDGLLAWRAFVAWDRPSWLRYSLTVALVLHSSVMVGSAILLIADNEASAGMLVASYKAWIWIAFVINSTLSFSIIFRIRRLGDFKRQGTERYFAALRAIIESAMLSWVATLSCAVLWSIPIAGTPGVNRTGPDHFIMVSLNSDAGTPWDRFATVAFLALPSIMGISQLLIVARLNISKCQSVSDACKTLSVLALEQSWVDADDDSSHSFRVETTSASMRMVTGGGIV